MSQKQLEMLYFVIGGAKIFRSTESTWDWSRAQKNHTMMPQTLIHPKQETLETMTNRTR